MEILWGEVLSIQINPNRKDYFKKCCSIFWKYEEEFLQDGCQLKIRNNGDIVSVNVFDNGSIFCQGSPKNPFLEEVKEIIERIENIIELPFNESDHQLIHRAQILRDYIDELDLEKAIHRMSIVIISDTSCEILLKARAKLIAEKRRISIKSLKLDDRGKIYKFIQEKNCIEVMEKRIKNLRGRRNKLVHQGDIPTKKDAELSIYDAEQLLETVRKIIKENQ